ncbi:MAG: G8 domain-containing protein [Elusimicrobiota bacterium]|nr:G8 domain-containing protein [Elusimicrobiota bacterium]
MRNRVIESTTAGLLLALTLASPARGQTLYGDFSTSTGAVYQTTGQIDSGQGVAADTVTAGGPFVLVAGNNGNSGTAFVVKLSSTGVALASAAFIPSGIGQALGVAVDASGNAWVAGILVGTGSYSSWHVRKYDPSLVLLASHTIAGYGVGEKTANAVAVDASGNAYAVGHTTNGANGQDILVVKYSPSLVVLATATLGTAAYGEHAEAVALDASGNAFVTGYRYQVGYDYFTAKLDANLVLLATAVYDGGLGTDRAFGVATDPSGNAFVTGEVAVAAGYAVRTVRYDASLSQTGLVSHDPGIGYDSGRGAVFIGTNTLAVLATVTNANVDAALLEYDASLNLISSQTYDGGGSDDAYGLAGGVAGQLYATLESLASPDLAMRTIRLTAATVSSGTSVSTPTAPSAFNGVAQSTSSVLWTWTDASSDEAGFRVLLGTSNLSGDLAAGATTWLQTGLGVNAAVGPLSLQAFNAYGTANASMTWTRHSLAQAPTAFTASAVHATSASFSWNTGANPLGGQTGFLVYRSTTGLWTPVVVDTSAVSTLTLTDLVAATSYYFRIRAQNFDGVYTAYDSTVSFVTAAAAPPGCAALTSVSSGAWSSAATWSVGRAPTACDSVTVAAGHAVTVDTTSAVAYRLDVPGTLAFSRSSSTVLTLQGGSMTVSGVLDMGTEASPIPGGVSATLALSSGAFTGTTALSVTATGRFWLHGEAKTPSVTASASDDLLVGENTLTLPASASSLNWKVGDRVVVGPSQGRGRAAAEERVISGIAGAVVALDAPFATIHYASAGVRVVNLDRNVVVRGAGTHASSTTAHISLNGSSADGFIAAYARFSSLGALTRFGINVEAGAAARVSSSTFMDNWHGLYAVGDAGVYRRNIFYRSVRDGIYLVGRNIDFTGNDMLGNAWRGFYQSGGGDYLYATDNEFYANDMAGFWANGQAYNMTVIRNRSYSNGTGFSSGSGFCFDNSSRRNVIAFNSSRDTNYKGLHLDGSNNLVVGNDFGGSDYIGLGLVDRGFNTFIDNFIHDHADGGMRIAGYSVGTEFIGGGLGYTPAGVARADGGGSFAEIILVSTAAPGNVTLRGVRVNPAAGINQHGDTGNGLTQDQYLLSYNQDADTGTVRVWGHYAPASLSLTVATRTYGARLVPAQVMRGTATVTASVSAPVDANAVTQLVTARYASVDGLWRVSGSVSGALGTFPMTGGSAAFPSGAPQFTLTLTATTPQDGDLVAWAVIAAAPDAGTRKRLLVGPVKSIYNSGRSRIVVAPGATFELAGAPGQPAVLASLVPGSTDYFMFQASGTFSAQDAAISDLDGTGLHFSGTAGVSLSSVTFDYLGVTAGQTASFITANGLTSSATFQSVAFLTSRATTTAAAAYNVRVIGADAGLNWLFRGDPAGIWGESYDLDAGGRVAWDGGPMSPPTGFAGAALSPTAILWSWLDNATSEAGYSVMSGTTSASGDLAADAASWTQTGLTPDTSYGPYFARAFHGGAPSDSAAASARTLAAVPTGTAVSSYTATAATISWTLNGNPATTVAQVHRSTDGASYALHYASSVVFMRDASLLGCTSYYYKVRNLNGDAVATAFDAAVLVRTADTVPAPPASLSAEAVAGGRVSLHWTGSPTEGVTGYRLFSDGGTGVFDFNAPMAVFTSTASAYETGVLASSAAYAFVLRATHRCGTVDATGVSAAAASTATLAAVRASIKNPDSGKRINGNSVTIMAELTSGTPSQVSQVRFQYRASTSAAWADIPAANANHPNPDLSAPYFTHWNVTAVTAGDYQLRAVAYDASGAADPAPGAITVTVTAVSPDITENLVGGDIQKSQALNNAVVNTIATGGGEANDPLAKIVLPPGALDGSTVTVTVEANPTVTTAPPSGLTAVGSYLRIDLDNGQHQLANGQTACITMSYPSSGVDPSRLSIYSYDDAAARWTKDFSSTVNASSRTITGCTPHFSIFAVFAGVASATMLDAVRVYPNPYKPNGGDPDAGKPFRANDATTGIIFDNLPAAVVIEIYSLTGRRVARFDTSASGGLIRWDARNTDGRDVASGGYFAVISSPGLKSTVKKLLIIR